MANHGIQVLRRIATEVAGALLGGLLFSKYASDDNKEMVSRIGSITGLAAIMGLNIFADDKIEKEAVKEGKREVSKLEKPNGISYRADHAERLKSEKPSQSNSIQI